MTTFDDREKQFETEFAHDASLKFKVESRRAKLVGSWAAGKMGLTGDEAEEYAKSVARADMEEAGHEDVFRKLRADLDGAREAVSDDEIRGKMAECLDEALRQVRGQA
ncbi:MAG: DUF1476 domain-containing protein [Pseudomonadota bacterium]